MIRRAFSAFTTLAVAIALTIPFGAATASASTDDYTHLRNYWTQYGVSGQVQEQLIRSMEAGENPDSMTLETEPIAVRTVREGTMETTVLQYPDGSVSTQSIQAPRTAGGVSASGISECSVTQGSGWVRYSGCKVSAGNGSIYISFKVTYEKYSQANAEIKNHGSSNVSAPGGSATDPTVSGQRRVSTRSLEAFVKYHTVFERASGGGNEDIYLGFWLKWDGTRSSSLS
ncbi:hypothetical protein [Promicromonospora sp. NPDC060271]|uniref:hypothetical protein n=1 Tax=Promicromonospora sp. NPDC060271 TaxID=3347089 RepID=UPI00365C73BF